ncbi:hypothetical protein GQ600_18799 [Phytophthora cactorum]|nr:hypothetical protein GQ600_18799 [Phytophthora cactorum]
MYYIPLGREMCLWMDGVDASRSTGERCFKRNTALSSTLAYGPQLEGGILPCPFLCAAQFMTILFFCLGKQTQLELKKRLGFIKLAICQGPYVRLRRKWLYNMWTPSKSVTDFFRKTFGIPVLIFWGKFWWMPKAPAEGKRYGLVYGKPIITKHDPTQPTKKFVQFMPNSIFKQYKSEFDYEDDETLAIF